MRNANSFKSLHDDFVLVDESQDFPEEFLRRYLSLIKENRFVWRLNEMQQLDNTDVRSLTEIFDLDQFGKPHVSLLGTSPTPWWCLKRFDVEHCL